MLLVNLTQLKNATIETKLILGYPSDLPTPQTLLQLRLHLPLQTTRHLPNHHFLQSQLFCLLRKHILIMSHHIDHLFVLCQHPLRLCLELFQSMITRFDHRIFCIFSTVHSRLSKFFFVGKCQHLQSFLEDLPDSPNIIILFLSQFEECIVELVMG